MGDEFKILIMYSGLIDVPEDKEHDRINGLSVEYFFFGSNGEMVTPKISADGISGIRRGKSFLSPETVNKISYVPGIYNGHFEMTVDSKGKPTLKLRDLDFVAKASITEMPDKSGGGK